MMMLRLRDAEKKRDYTLTEIAGPYRIFTPVRGDRIVLIGAGPAQTFAISQETFEMKDCDVALKPEGDFMAMSRVKPVPFLTDKDLEAIAAIQSPCFAILIDGKRKRVFEDAIQRMSHQTPVGASILAGEIAAIVTHRVLIYRATLDQVFLKAAFVVASTKEIPKEGKPSVVSTAATTAANS